MEDALHPPIDGKGVGVEGGDAAAAGGHGEVLEENASDAAALVLVLHHERDLGAVARFRVGVVAGDGDDLAAQFGDEGQAAVEVHVGEVFDLAFRQRRPIGEEAHLPGLG